MSVSGDTDVVGADMASVIDSMLTVFTGASLNDQTVVQNPSFAEAQPHAVWVHALLEHNWGRTYSITIQAETIAANLFQYDNSMMNGLQALKPWQTFMHHPKGAYLGLINATQAIGGFAAYPLIDGVENTAFTLAAVCCFIFLGTGLQTGAKSRDVYCISIICRYEFCLFSARYPCLVGETAYPTHRGIITAIFQTLYYVGSTLSAWVTFGTRNMDSSWAWSIPSLLQFAIPILVVGIAIAAPESLRFLIARGRTEEARAILVKHHAGGDEDSPLVAFEVAEIESALKEFHAQASYMDMLRTKGNRHRTFVGLTLGIFAQWNGYLVSVLKTVKIASTTNQTLINGFLQVFNLIAAVTAAGLVDKLGRRFLLITSSVGMLICYIIITGLAGCYAETKHAGVGIAVVPMLFVYYFFYDIAFTPLIASYPVENWPYQLRSRGIVLTHAATYAALFFNLFVNPIALAAIAWKYYIVYVAILVFICITVWFTYPETSGYSLEEIAVVFNGEDAKIVNPDKVLESVDAHIANKKEVAEIEG
ncbi:Lactose permease [Lachnellula subtilissima]|uniref:Lactose permease n=1 Tax=Lachnellula subtilissima TaxID=602034 RepID=A0A8H8RMY7_9HELO|nr:Lactose permease [Lachnellula subtilissima]